MCSTLRIYLGLLSAVLFSAEPADAGSLCRALAIRATPAVHSPYQTNPGVVDSHAAKLRVGDKVDEVTQYIVDGRRGDAVFCVSGGPCYAAQSITLLNCVVGANESADAHARVALYGLVPIRSKISADELRRNDVANALSAMGFSNAAAHSGAAGYVHRPGSTCWKTVKAALKGERAACRALIRGACED